jgi:hypothetical protein
MNRKRNWVIGIALTAAAGFLALQNGTAPATDIPQATEIPATITPTDVQPNEQCAYVWAYHNADEASAMIDTELRAIDPATSGNASFYGEDCVYADGHSTFSVRETDFYVRIPVDDLTNEDTLGNWMGQVLKVALEIPDGLIKGNYGFVEFWFEDDDAGHTIVRVPVQEYLDNGQGKSGVELFQMFSDQP